ncbi:MAG: formate dehydrogenase accessory sulfurtransferase FdhD, partial [Candidatus Limnocylindrales bacterium]
RRRPAGARAVRRREVTVAEAPSRSTGTAPILAVSGRQAIEREELLVGEEPLELRACGPGQKPVDIAVTMRTPGDEADLAVGFLISEGLVRPADLAGARCEPGHPGRMALPENEMTVRLSSRFDAARVAKRTFIATASCGICGKASIDDIVGRCEPVGAGPVVGRSVLIGLPDAMRRAQPVFASTGGLHAAALFSPAGQLVEVREDVGRHNALDKVIGARMLAGDTSLSSHVLLVSGRVSFEIVQKAAMAGLALLAAVSAPSDLAIATAERLGMTLVGFLRGDRFNIYLGRERIDLSD